MRAALVLLMLVLCATARGSPSNARVVLADPDPELLRAVASALSPWHLEVIVQTEPPSDLIAAGGLATEREARFVVWRQGGDLVVFDRERGDAEHREGRIGPLDPVSAAAAALTIKTLMRLPPPVEEVVPVTPAAPAEESVELRVQAGGGGRLTLGLTADLGARATGAVMVRPWLQRGWRFGVAGDAGTTTSIQNAGFKGTWTDWAVFGVASWTIGHRGWDLEPHVAAGVLRSSFTGLENGTIRGDNATLAALRGGLAVRRRFGEHWSVGGALDVDALLATPAYPKLVGNGEVFAVPDVALALGLFVAADVGL
jgi:hypothetical protein